jgi:hypothetical protein
MVREKTGRRRYVHQPSLHKSVSMLDEGLISTLDRLPYHSRLSLAEVDPSFKDHVCLS